MSLGYAMLSALNLILGIVRPHATKTLSPWLCVFVASFCIACPLMAVRSTRPRQIIEIFPSEKSAEHSLALCRRHLTLDGLLW